MPSSDVSLALSVDSATHTLRYGECLIPYRISRLPRTKQKLTIKVDPSLKVLVLAPDDAGDDEIKQVIQQRARWVWQQLETFRKQRGYVLPRRYVSGESYFYLGRRHVLKVTVDPNATQGVKLLRGKLCVLTRSAEPKKVREMLWEWYRGRARELFKRRLDALLPKTLWMEQRPPLRLLSMQTQWGSCSPEGRLTLNPHLVKAPRECVDYVLLHEVCHIAEHNHSDRFYRLLNQVMPGWQTVKDRLDSMAELILNE